MRRARLLAAGLLALAAAAPAAEFFYTHAATPYPPGCVEADPGVSSTLNGTRDVVIEGYLNLTGFPGPGKENVQIRILRKGCMETGRSVLFVELELISPGPAFRLPRASAQIGDSTYPLRLVREPGTYEENQENQAQGFGRKLFIIDGATAAQVKAGDDAITPGQYNSAFTLVLEDPGDAANTFFIEITAYTGGFKPQRFPLSGRLSGTWVVEGIPDQGFFIAFEEFVDESGLRSLVFFSWYTYAPDGSTLWLTAADFHAPGASSIDLEIELVTNGEFMGSKLAERSVIGTATLTALSCNRLQLDYDLSALGLGSGTIFLERLFSLETAGHACRDVDARLEALQ